MSNELTDIDKIIQTLFWQYWHGDAVRGSLDKMRDQLYKNLDDQVKGYWSGSSAYYVMTKGGFLMDAKSCTKKKLTHFGQMFMDEYESKLEQKEIKE